MKTSVAQMVLWSAIGVLIAVVLHYMLYRMTLPIQPFIYQAF